MVVHDALSAKTKAAHTPVVVTSPRPHGKFAKKKYYAVEPGDSMTAIARKTGVPLSTLESLNPHVDPNSLQTGQRLRLRR